MDLVYSITAAVGCTALLAQVALQLFGLGGDHEAHIDHDIDAHEGDGNLFFGLLSFKTLSAFAAFFGLAGLAAAQAGVDSDGLRLTLALCGGAAAGAIVMLMMRGLAKLRTSGTVDLDEAVDKTARVYLAIPAGGGQGKIIVELRGREVELLAQSSGPDIPTGASVRVLRRLPGDCFEVSRI